MNSRDRVECIKQLQKDIQTEEDKKNLKVQIACLKLLDPKLTEENKHKYLTELKRLSVGTNFQNDVTTWIESMEKPVVEESDYSISDTDHPNDLFLLGEEVSDSCQKITGTLLSKQGTAGLYVEWLQQGCYRQG